MAFNPFHRFRKHRRAVFAVLTIICMFVFVLQFGRGDAIERLLRLFGASRARGEYVTTLHGVKFHVSDLEKLSRRREIANTFMRGVLEQAREAAFKDAGAQENA